MGAISETLIFIIALGALSILIFFSVQYRYIIYRMARHSEVKPVVPFNKVSKKAFLNSLYEQLTRSTDLANSYDIRTGNTWENPPHGWGRKGKVRGKNFSELVVSSAEKMHHQLASHRAGLRRKESIGFAEWVAQLGMEFQVRHKTIAALQQIYNQARFRPSGVGMEEYRQFQAARTEAMRVVLSD